MCGVRVVQHVLELVVCRSETVAKVLSKDPAAVCPKKVNK